MRVYTLYTLDIWGNESDGYDVNDSFKQGQIKLPYAFTDTQLLDAIDALVGLTGRDHAEIDDADGFIEIRERGTGMPVFHLYLDEAASAKPSEYKRVVVESAPESSDDFQPCSICKFCVGPGEAMYERELSSEESERICAECFKNPTK